MKISFPELWYIWVGLLSYGAILSIWNPYQIAVAEKCSLNWVNLHKISSSALCSSLRLLLSCLYLSRYSGWIRAGRPGFNHRQGQDIFIFSTASNPALGLIQPPGGTGGFFPGDKLPRHWADSSPPASEAKNGGALPSLPIRLHGVVLN
jgi:hypothetical protein